MAKYRKKPVVIEAVQFREGNFEEILNFSSGKAKRRISYEGNAPVETKLVSVEAW